MFVPLRGVGQDDLVAGLEALPDLDEVHRGAAEADRHALRDAGDYSDNTDTRSETTGETLRLIVDEIRMYVDSPSDHVFTLFDELLFGRHPLGREIAGTIGSVRAARHEAGRVIMYANNVTRSMQATIDETERRRKIQETYNKEHGITPQGVRKAIEKGMRPDLPEEAKRAKLNLNKIPKDEYKHLIKDLEGQMDMAAANLEFEKAAELRDIIEDIRQKL